MLQVARMYYEDDLGQQEIGEHLNLSRQKVSRLLKEARAQGIVQIQLSDPFAPNPELEQQFQDNLGLGQIVLTPGEGLSSKALQERLGVTAADYLIRTMPDNALAGIGWGRTLHEMVRALNTERQAAIHVVPLIGGIGQLSPSFQVNELARQLADAFHGTWRALYMPAFTEDLAAWKTLVGLEEVRSVTQLWSQVRPAIVGIGHFEFQRQSSMYFANSMSQRVLAEYEDAGAVGDICGRFFDAQGTPIDIGAGVLGISLDQLRSLDGVVAIAGGLEKAPAILAALRGGYIGTLITDTVTARAVLAQNDRAPAEPRQVLA
jgi:DNA-binding transcriptional regulator LsrR (DeoR family)